MLNKLMELLRKGNLVDQATTETDDMFQNSKQLYQEAISVLAENRKPQLDIYALDKKINNCEKSIRRKVLENLSINRRQDIVSSLVLTSIIIDIERIGDYSKNIFELSKLCVDSSATTIDPKLLSEANALLKEFDAVGKALSAGDDKLAHQLMERLNPMKQGFESYICSIISSSRGTVAEATINVLFSRYLKRVTAHLSNIASSIANPFDLIGFFSDDSAREAD